MPKDSKFKAILTLTQNKKTRTRDGAQRESTYLARARGLLSKENQLGRSKAPRGKNFVKIRISWKDAKGKGPYLAGNDTK